MKIYEEMVEEGRREKNKVEGTRVEESGSLLNSFEAHSWKIYAMRHTIILCHLFTYHCFKKNHNIFSYMTCFYFLNIYCLDGLFSANDYDSRNRIVFACGWEFLCFWCCVIDWRSFCDQLAFILLYCAMRGWLRGSCALLLPHLPVLISTVQGS